MKVFIRNNWILLCILALYLFIGLYNLDGIPAEIWGDAIAHYNLAERVLHGRFFYNYAFGGDGPIFTYLVVIVSAFVPLSFYSLKLTAVVIGFFFILSMYFLSQEFFKNKTIALIAATVSTISFWTIVFVRQPHARILVPLFICLTLIFTLKKKNTMAGVILGLGMYTQASIWGLILVYWRNFRTLIIGLLLTIPLAFSFASGSVDFFSPNSYYGEKLAVHTPLLQVITAILYNIQANLLSFNFRGDKIFRMNIPYHPHLDIISGILFVAGFLLILYQSIKKKQKMFILYFILPFFFIQIPSELDIHNYIQQPNISRMIGVIPFVYMSIAYCIYTIAQFFSSKVSSKQAKNTITFCIYYSLLVSIFIINFYNYFVIFPRTLPNGNTPFGKTIAQTIDMSQANTNVVIIGAGWGQYAQPEVAGIPMVQKTVHTELFSQTVQEAQFDLCAAPAKGKPILIAGDPDFQNQMQSANFCIKNSRSYMLTKNGWNIAYIIQGNQ
jgi:hypothetical protein